MADWTCERGVLASQETSSAACAQHLYPTLDQVKAKKFCTQKKEQLKQCAGPAYGCWVTSVAGATRERRAGPNGADDDDGCQRRMAVFAFAKDTG